MPIYFDVDLRDWRARQEQKRKQEAIDRLKALFGAEDTFGVQPPPQAEDLLAYQTATGGQTWPKERLSEDEMRNIQQDVTGDELGMLVNFPTEVVAQPMTRQERIGRQAREDTLGEITKDRALGEYQPEQWRRDWDQLGQFAEEKDFDLSGEDMLANIGIKRAPITLQETWEEPYQGPGGSYLQKSSRGQVRSVLGRETTRGATGPYVKTIDLGDRVRGYKADGTYEDLPKNVSPNTLILGDRRRVTDEMALRKQFQSLPETKDFVLIKSQMERLDRAMGEARSGTGSLVAVDQALITILNKMLDPSSVVRESEYARTPGDLSMLNRLKGKIDKLRSGGAGLTQEDREAIARMARNFYEVAEGMYDQQAQWYSDMARDYGYAPENIVRLGGIMGGGRYVPRESGQYGTPATAEDYLQQYLGGQ